MGFLRLMTFFAVPTGNSVGKSRDEFARTLGDAALASISGVEGLPSNSDSTSRLHLIRSRRTRHEILMASEFWKDWRYGRFRIDGFFVQQPPA